MPSRAWRLPTAIVALAVLAVVLLPGADPAPLFGAAFAAVAIAAVLYVVLLRRERKDR